MITFYLSKSEKKNKKYTVRFTNPKTNRINNIHFGDSRYEDYTMHKDKDRKNSYIMRHQDKEDWDDYTKSGFWAKHILWNKKTIPLSIQDIESKFKNIKIVES